MGLARGRWGPVLVRPYRSGGLSWKGRTRTGIAGAIIRGLTRDTYFINTAYYIHKRVGSYTSYRDNSYL